MKIKDRKGGRSPKETLAYKEMSNEDDIHITSLEDD